MILSDVVLRVADDCGSKSTLTDVNARIVREINRVCSKAWDSFNWTFRSRVYWVTTNAENTGGSLTATNGSRTVTGSGVGFTSNMGAPFGWYIQFLQDPVMNWYRIRAFTSSSQVELEVPYQGTSGAAKTYLLRQLDYVLPTEIYDIRSVINTYDNSPISIIEPASIDFIEPNPLNKGFPFAASIYSSDSVPTVYSTGTVSGTLNTQTVTGSGTAWLGTVTPGDLLTIGTNIYTVRSTDADTGLTLYNNLQATVAASAYTITRQFGRVLRIIYSSTDFYVLGIRGLRKYAPLVNNNDTNELLYRYPDAVIEDAAALELKQKADKRWPQALASAKLKWSEAKAEDDSLTPRQNASPVFSYRTQVRQRTR